MFLVMLNSPELEGSFMNTLVDAIKSNYKKHSDEDWLIIYEEGKKNPIKVSYTKLIDEALKWSKLYKNLKIKPQQNIIISLPLSIHLYASHIGAILIGAVPSIYIHPNIKIDKSDFLASLEKTINFHDYQTLVTTPELQTETKTIVENCITPEQLKDSCLLSEVACPPESSIAIHQYSSGTTGLKKRLPLTHNNLIKFIYEYSQTLNLNIDSDKICSWLPLYHDMGFIACFMLPLVTRAKLISMSAQDWVMSPQSLLKNIEEYKATICWLPNFAFPLLQKTYNNNLSLNLSNLKALISSSELVRPTSVEKFFDTFMKLGIDSDKLAACYGLAENTYAATQSKIGKGLRTISIDREYLDQKNEIKRVVYDAPNSLRVISCGSPLKGVTLKIDAVEGEVGDVLIKGPYLFEGYSGKTLADSNIDSNGYFNTKDRGFILDEELFLLGRSDDVIIIAGTNIYPEDIEELCNNLKLATPGRSVAFGTVDESSGTEELIVLIETKSSSNSDIEYDRDNLSRLIQSIYGNIKVSSFFVKSRTLKKSTSGKISRRKNKDLYQKNEISVINSCSSELILNKKIKIESLTDSGSKSEEKIKECVINAIKKNTKYGTPKITRETQILTLGLLDSLSVAFLICSLENTFNITLDNRKLDISDFQTIQTIQRLIEINLKPENKVNIKNKSKKTNTNFMVPVLREMGERTKDREVILHDNAVLKDIFSLNDASPFTPFYNDTRAVISPNNFKSETLNTDSLGFRKSIICSKTIELEQFYTLSGIKTLILGGSSAFGIGSPDALTFPNILNSKFNQNCEHYYNLSMRSSDIASEYEILKTFYKPSSNRVILFTGGNDFEYFTRSLHTDEITHNILYSYQEIQMKFEKFLIEFEENLIKIRDYCQTKNTDFLFVLQVNQPFSDISMNPVEAVFWGDLRSVYGWRLFKAYFRANKFSWKLSCLYQNKIAAICKKLNIPFCNPNKELQKDNNSAYFFDYWHYTAEGNEAIANIISKAIDSRFIKS